MEIAAEARQRAEWARASSIIAAIVNVNLPEGAKPFDPADFNPMEAATRRSSPLSFSLEGARDRFELPTAEWNAADVKVDDAG